jgi:hypothetical protein
LTIFSQKYYLGDAMNELSMSEINAVSGGDAAATRQRGQNSYGEWVGDPLEALIDYLMRIEAAQEPTKK